MRLQTYDKQAISALVATLRLLFELRPSVHVLIAGTVRNVDTFGSFTHACGGYIDENVLEVQLTFGTRTEQVPNDRNRLPTSTNPGTDGHVLRKSSTIQDLFNTRTSRQ